MTQETDRELLELAAKAAGHEYRFNNSTNAGPHFIRCATGYQEWNPRTDDGDAQRLAVDLGINVVHSAAGAAVFLHRPPEILSWGCAFSYENDPYAATRRAILSAAAEIGKAMQ